ncbi:MAG TPA: electron transfer flavoprotein subunit alpha [Armatimonadota bacterium]|nr:electron transfer flavoprotein subunit alpha [Armatimonadota bacterium]
MRKKRPPVIIDGKLCIGCEQCLAACPVDAIRMENGIAIVDMETCIGCGECVKACPVTAIAFPPGTEVEVATVAPVEQVEAAPAATAGAPAPEVWVFIEHLDGVAAAVSWELLGHGAKLAADIGGGRVAAALLGHGVEELARAAIAHGADRVYLVDDPVLAHYRTEAYLRGMVRLVAKHRPEIMLLGATTTGRDLAGAVATSLRTGLTADCTGLTIDPQSKLLEQTRPAYGGNIMATILCERRRPQMATVRPRVLPLPEPDDARQGEIVREELGLTEDEVAVKLIEYVREEAQDEARLEEAQVIVAGGRGLGGPKGFEMLQELAETLHGVVAASRAAVDSGWRPHSFQVGQTGKTVRPRIYFACGISGAVQHLVGMQTSDVIIAINRDPSAPIFQTATYGIVGDVYEVVPALTRAARARLSAT